MIIDKNELSRKLGQLKEIVPRKTTIQAMQGVLVSDGYLIASNTELTVKAKLEGSEGERFIIPEKAFDLIGTYPSGDLTITADDTSITIKMDRIVNKFLTHPADDFAYNREGINVDGTSTISYGVLSNAIGHVLYAVAAAAGNKTMTGIYLECIFGKMNLVGLDGHRVAMDTIDFEGNFNMIVPKSAAEKLIKLDMNGDVSISSDKNGAIFKTDDYEIYTRLIDGEYFKYGRMFEPGDYQTEIDRKSFMDSINRARLCGSSDDKRPVIMKVGPDTVQITYKSGIADYADELPLLVNMTEPLKIAFDPKLLLDSLKSFSCENVTMIFKNAKSPVIMKADDCEMAALVLPVAFTE